MEITELNLIGDFEAGMKCLQNPSISFFSRFSPIHVQYSFWKWGALILAFCATFTSLINRIKLLIYQIRLKYSIASYQQSRAQNIYSDDDDFDFDFSDDDDDDDTPSSVAGSDEEEDYQKPADEVFRAEGSCFWGRERGQDGNLTLHRPNGFSWSDFSAGKSVVQLWDSFGLGLDFEDDSDDEREIVIWDLDRDVKLSSGRRCQVPAAAAANVVLTAQMNDVDGIGLGAYDARVDSTAPAIYAAWRPRQRNVHVKGNGVGGGVEDVTDLDGELWSDADGVIGEKEE